MNKNFKNIVHSKPIIEEDDIKAIEGVLYSGMIASGQKVSEFENALCKYIGSLKAKATSSGSSALVLALLTLGVKPGDEIIIPTYVCRSVLDAILFLQAKPVIVDIDNDYCISINEILNNITKKTKAIIVVHIFGIAAEIREILDIAKKYGIYVIEDCAQSIGGEINKKKLGSFGDLSFFSFHATKVLTSGEGGMLNLNNSNLLFDFEKVIAAEKRFFTISDIQAALGLNQLRKLNELIKKRRILAEKYINLLENVPFVLLPVRDLRHSIFFRFPVRVKKTFDFLLLRKKMSDYGIHVRKGVDVMLHHILNIRCYAASEVLFNETVSLPIYPSLEIDDVEFITKKFIELCQ